MTSWTLCFLERTCGLIRIFGCAASGTRRDVVRYMEMVDLDILIPLVRMVVYLTEERSSFDTIYISEPLFLEQPTYSQLDSSQ